MSKTMYNGEEGEDKSLLTNQTGEKREGLPLHRQEREMGRKPGGRLTSSCGCPCTASASAHTPRTCAPRATRPLPARSVSFQALSPQRAPQHPSDVIFLTPMSLSG